MSGTKSGGGPESDFLNTLKKKRVVLALVARAGEADLVTGILAWVDRFSYGIADDDGDVVMVSKHCVMTISADDTPYAD